MYHYSDMWQTFYVFGPAPVYILYKISSCHLALEIEPVKAESFKSLKTLWMYI